ncbi:MAG TPA: hypothetical protein VN649_04825 [Ramlibacter sp.]|nr:hypothetical protein [Ramlibacter sp.]
MFIDVFGVQLKLAQSTSPVPGKLAATVVAGDQRVWADFFLWDPLSQVIQFDEEALHQLMRGARRTQSPWASGALTVTDFGISVVQGIKRLSGGSYGGSLGFGQMGAITAMASALFFIVVSIMAAVVIAPLSIVAWLLRQKIDSDINKEKPRVLEQAIGFFQAIKAQ